MSHRVYLRRSQKASDQTTTDVAAIARLAFDYLLQLPEASDADVAWTNDGKQVQYSRAKDRRSAADSSEPLV